MTGTDTSGFYKCDGTAVYYAPNSVTGPDFALSREDTIQTAQGWAFYSDEQAAQAALDAGHVCRWPSDPLPAPTPPPTPVAPVPPPRPVKAAAPDANR